MNQSFKNVTAALLLGSLLLNGCSAASSPTPDTIYIQSAENEDTHRITINTRETVTVSPDKASIRFAISTENENAEVCQQENTEKLSDLLTWLMSQGVAEESIQTTGFSLNPRYSWSSNRQTLIGYEMTTQISVSDIAMEQTGVLLSGAVKNGANEIQSVTYYASGYDAAYEEALAKAVESARRKAAAIAAADNCQAADLLSVEEYSDSQSGRYINSGIRTAVTEDTIEAVSGSANMDVMAGQLQVTASIQAVFQLSNDGT